MRTSRGILLLLATIIFFAMASVAFAEQAPAGSFVKTGVSTVSDLLGQLKDPVVAQRYEAVYNLSASDIASKIKDFKLITLKSPMETPVYYIDKAGKIASKSQILPEGTAVFADADGNPAICWWSGNPLGSRSAILPLENAGTAAGAAGTSAAGTAAGTTAGAAATTSAASWAVPVIGAAAAVAIISSGSSDSNATPEPASLIVIATGLAGLPLIRRFKKL